MKIISVNPPLMNIMLMGSLQSSGQVSKIAPGRSGAVSSKDLWFMHSLKNDFLAAGNAAFVAKNYRSAKNLRYELKLRTRCNPAIEIGDRVEVLDRSGSSIGEFCVAAQTFHFSKSGLYADITLASASTAD